jgi:hypothetical protein
MHARVVFLHAEFRYRMKGAKFSGNADAALPN